MKNYINNIKLKDKDNYKNIFLEKNFYYYKNKYN